MARLFKVEHSLYPIITCAFYRIGWSLLWPGQRILEPRLYSGWILHVLMMLTWFLCAISTLLNMIPQVTSSYLCNYLSNWSQCLYSGWIQHVLMMLTLFLCVISTLPNMILQVTSIYLCNYLYLLCLLICINWPKVVFLAGFWFLALLFYLSMNNE